MTTYDISPVGCERTSRALREVRVERVDIEREPIGRRFDLVFVMGVLGYVHGRGRLDRMTARIAGALRPGGLLVFNEPRIEDSRFESCWWARAFSEGGLPLLYFLDGRHGLRLIHHEIHRRHVIGIYESTRHGMTCG